MQRASTLVVLVLLALVPACGGGDRPTVTGGTVASPGAGAVPSGAPCPDVAIAPQSSNGAFDVRVTGASCDQATAVAKAAPRDGSSYIAAGFGCEAGPGTQPPGGGMAGWAYRCLMGNLLVTFTRH
jgi:hypothetical protein